MSFPYWWDREFSCGIIPAEPAAKVVANREEQAGCRGLSVGRVEGRHDLQQRFEVLGIALRWKRPDILEPEVGRDLGGKPAGGFMLAVLEPPAALGFRLDLVGG